MTADDAIPSVQATITRDAAYAAGRSRLGAFARPTSAPDSASLTILAAVVGDVQFTVRPTRLAIAVAAIAAATDA